MFNVKDLVSQATELEARSLELQQQAKALQEEAKKIRQDIKAKGFQHDGTRFCIDVDGDLKIYHNTAAGTLYLDKEAIKDFLAWLTSASQ